MASATPQHGQDPRLLAPLPALEALRAIAIIMIMLRHAAYGFYMLTGRESGFLQIGGINFYPAFINGWIWMDLFFIIAGFTAARQWLHDPGTPYRRFIFAHLRPVVPLYLVVLLLSVSGLIPYYIPNQPTDWGTIFYHALMVQDVLLPAINIFISSLAAEVKYYILVPFVIMACLRREKSGRALLQAGAFFLIVGLCFRAYGFSRFHTSPDTVAEIFSFFINCRLAFFYVVEPVLLGVALAWLEKQARDGRLRGLWQSLTAPDSARMAFAFFAAILFSWTISIDHLDTLNAYDGLVQPFLTAAIMAGLTFGVIFSGGPRFLQARLLAYHGQRLFYPAYLIHIPVLPMAYYLLLPLLGEGSPTVLFFTFTGLFFLLTWLASEALFHAIQKLFLPHAALAPG